MTEKRSYGFDWVLDLDDLDAGTRQQYEAARQLADEAADLEEQAERLQAKAAEVRGQAYQKALVLEAHVRTNWTTPAINRAKHNPL